MNSRCNNKMTTSAGTKRENFFNFPQNTTRNQEIFTVVVVAIAVDSFYSSFCHQEMPKQPSYISLWNTLL